MGMNIQSACHKCKEKVFHFRNQEHKTIMPFYRRHKRCMSEDRNNVVTLDDQYQDEDWMDDNSEYKEFGE